MSDDLRGLAARVATLLVQRRETLAIAESSAGGLISAALLAAPGASQFFIGGGVIYSGVARAGFLALTPDRLGTVRPATEAYAALLAESVRVKLGNTWGLGESGAAGPTGNRYGDAPGHCCFAFAGPSQSTGSISTDHPDRWANMQAFAHAALSLLEAVLRQR